MKGLIRTILAGVVLVSFATAAQAQGYIGGALGLAATDPALAEAAIDEYNALVYGPGNDCDALNCWSSQDSAGAGKIFGGYRFTPNLAIEGFAAFLGAYESEADDGFGVYAATDADVTSIGVAAVGTIPMSDRIGFFGKLGLHSWKADGTTYLQDLAIPFAGAGSFEETGVDFMGGIGLNIGVTDQFAMRVEYEYFAASTDYTDFGLGLFSVGAVYQF